MNESLTFISELVNLDVELVDVLFGGQRRVRCVRRLTVKWHLLSVARVHLSHSLQFTITFNQSWLQLIAARQQTVDLWTT